MDFHISIKVMDIKITPSHTFSRKSQYLYTLKIRYQNLGAQSSQKKPVAGVTSYI